MQKELRFWNFYKLFVVVVVVVVGGSGSAAEVFEKRAKSFGWINFNALWRMFWAYPGHSQGSQSRLMGGVR